MENHYLVPTSNNALLSQKKSQSFVPKEAAVVDDTRTVCPVGTVTDVDGGDIKASEAVGDGEIVSALKNAKNWNVSLHFLTCGEVYVLA